jgi:hypothetical protein
MEIIGLNAEETYKAEKQLKIKELENEIITWRAAIIYDDKEIIKIEKHKEQMIDWIKECEAKILKLKDLI